MIVGMSSVFITKQDAKQGIKHWKMFPEGMQGSMQNLC